MISFITGNEVNFRAIKKLYNKAFPRVERKSLWLIKKKEKQGLAKIIEIQRDGVFCGLIITAINDDVMLIDYFAISEEMRNKQIGTNSLSKFLEANKDNYRIFLEIELANDGDIKKQARKRFYLRNGLKESGVEITLFGVPMELLYCTEPVTFDEYHTLYSGVFGDKYAKKVKLVRERK